MTAPDLGLYQTKYAGRRLLARIPGLERLEPNHVSLAAFLPSVLAAWALVIGAWPLVIVGVAGRMALSTLDGHIAENHGKASRVGAYLNRLPAEAGDILLLLALFTRADPTWAALALGGAWLVNITGILALVAGGTIQSVGPAGQTDRQVLFGLVAALAMVTPVDWTLVAGVIAALCGLTVALRVRRSLRELQQLGELREPRG